MTLTLVRVVAPHFVAGFETDGTVRRAAPILRRLVGESDETARRVIVHFKWQAHIVVTEPQIIQHEESFEVRTPPTGRKFFYFDENAGRRAISGRMSKEKALLAAQAFMADKT
jgi:hypothetical protein